MKSSLFTAGMAVLGTLLLAVTPARAANLSGNALYFDQGAKGVQFCFPESRKCYIFRESNGECGNVAVREMIFDSNRWPYDVISGLDGLSMFRNFAATLKSAVPNGENLSVFIDLDDCGAPMGGAYAGALCIKIGGSENDKTPDGQFDVCTNATEDKSLRESKVGPID